MTTQVTIVHQGGSGTVSDFHHIEEVDEQMSRLRVFYTPEQVQNPMRLTKAEDANLYYEEYTAASIVEVWPDDDDEDCGGGVITVDS